MTTRETPAEFNQRLLHATVQECQRLELKCARLEQDCAKLLKTCKQLLGLWDDPVPYDAATTRAAARRAVAAIEGRR
jgi:hypothetical protein